MRDTLRAQNNSNKAWCSKEQGFVCCVMNEETSLEGLSNSRRSHKHAVAEAGLPVCGDCGAQAGTGHRMNELEQRCDLSKEALEAMSVGRTEHPSSKTLGTRSVCNVGM